MRWPEIGATNTPLAFGMGNPERPGPHPSDLAPSRLVGDRPPVTQNARPLRVPPGAPASHCPAPAPRLPMAQGRHPVLRAAPPSDWAPNREAIGSVFIRRRGLPGPSRALSGGPSGMHSPGSRLESDGVSVRHLAPGAVRGRMGDACHRAGGR
ncbi:hypothetical protein SMALA_3242 [Streptomyces malaysiensis subsp. malaysiensis]|nr:hypothetical protein SMALA_3242 [Streptomyces malaysiensis]